MKNLAGKTALITGAGGGIGSALARELAREKCHLALVDISADALNTLAEELAPHPINITTHIVDVTDESAMAALADEVKTKHGGINILINNAGITLQKLFSTHGIKDWQRMINLNLWGVIYGCHFFGDMLKQADGAAVVNMSSMAKFVGFPSQSSYCVTKNAVHALSECLWAEWSVDNVAVTCVYPGAVRTNIIFATLEDSDDVEAARRNNDMAMKFAVAPEKAARKIVNAIRHKRKKLVIGTDAHILIFLARMMPRFTGWLMKKIAHINVNRSKNAT